MPLKKPKPRPCQKATFPLLPPPTKLGQGYMFTGICHSVNGGCYPSMPCSRSPGGYLVPGGCLVPRRSAPGVWPSVMPFWYGGLLIEGGLLVWSSGEGPEGDNRRPPHQKAITVAWWRPSRTATAVGGTHPTGMHSCCEICLGLTGEKALLFHAL